MFVDKYSPFNEMLETDEELLEKSIHLDDEVRLTRHMVKRVCPITKKPFTNPVRNIFCRHVYEEAAIKAMHHARCAKGKLCPCPVAGCGENVDLWFYV